MRGEHRRKETSGGDSFTKHETTRFHDNLNGPLSRVRSVLVV